MVLSNAVEIDGRHVLLISLYFAPTLH